MRAEEALDQRCLQLRQEKEETEGKARRFLNLCTILVEDKDFLALISECTDRTILDAHVFATAQTTEYKHDLTTETNAFAKVKTLLGTYSLQQLPSLIQSLYKSFREHY